jgi:hypothetical protein
MPIHREVSEISQPLRRVVFADGTMGEIIQWLDEAGAFHDVGIVRPLALIVRDPVDGYHVVDLRTEPPAPLLAAA